MADPEGQAPAPATILDPLTGAYSIDYFEHQMRSEVAYSLRHGMPLSLVLFSVDYVGDLTEAFGKPAVERILAHVVRVVAELVRTEDVLARFGRHEFALLCRGTPIHAAGFLAKRIRQEVESSGVGHMGLELPITVSLGVATLQSDSEEHSDVVRSAERALADARATGNCLVVAHEA